jgi:hypothetical protein
MSHPKGSTEGIEDDDSIMKTLASFYEADGRVPEYFTLIGRTSGRQELALVQDGDDRTYPYFEKKPYPYPRNVQEHARNVTRRLYYGGFPEIRRFYCVADDYLYFWPITCTQDPPEFSVVRDPDGLWITAVTVARPSRDVFSPTVRYLLVYTTERAIHVLPVADRILGEKRLSLSLNFVPTALAAAPIEAFDDADGDSDDDEDETDTAVFIGGQMGNVYWLRVGFDMFDGVTRELLVMWPFSLNGVGRWFRSLFAGRDDTMHTIVRMAYDDTTKYLAALDAKSNLRFYKFASDADNWGKLTEVSQYGENEEFVSLDAVPRSDSQYVRFVCFTRGGDRVFFGHALDALWEPGKIEFIHKLPKLGDRGKVKAAFFALNQSVMVIDREISLDVKPSQLYVIQPRYAPDDSEMDPPQRVELNRFEPDKKTYQSFLEEDELAFNFVRARHPFADRPIPLFKHRFLWQHVTEMPVGYLMLHNGYRPVSFHRPVDTLAGALGQVHTMAQRKDNVYIGRLMTTVDTFVLLAAQGTDLPLTWLSSLEDERYRGGHPTGSDKTYKYYVKESPSYRGFYIRASRLLAVVWHAPVVRKKAGKWVVSTDFQKLPGSIRVGLQQLRVVARRYREVRETSSGRRRPSAGAGHTDELDWITQIRRFLKKMDRILEFIAFVADQLRRRQLRADPELNRAVEALSSDYRNRLSQPFGGTYLSLLRALQELARAIRNENRIVGELLRTKCPKFFTAEEQDLIEVFSQLKASQNAEDNPPMPLLQRTYNAYLNYLKSLSSSEFEKIERPFKFGEIIEAFKKYKYVVGIINVCLRTAEAVDRHNVALDWYHRDAPDDDRTARDYFNRRYSCYELCFEIIKSHDILKDILKSTDEIFHVWLYDWFSREYGDESLVKLTTPYLERFIKDRRPNLLYVYYAEHGEYAKAVDAVNELVLKDNTPLGESVRLLRDLVVLVRSMERDDIRSDVELRLNCAEVQLEAVRRQPSIGEALLSLQALFDASCENGFWDLVLRILVRAPLENKVKVISKAWINFTEGQLWEEPLGVARQRIIAAMDGIPPKSDVMAPDTVMPILEEHKYRKDGTELWAMETMVAAGFDKTLLLHRYVTAWQGKDMPNDIKCDFAYAAAKLVELGADPGDSLQSDREAIKTWFAKEATNCPYRDVAFRVINKL